MPDVLVRGLSEAAIRRFDEEARSLGVSRAEVLRRYLEAHGEQGGERPSMTPEDWDRFAHAFADLADAQIMRDAWR